jgi:V/A-type H+-transporting ATPase subunit I
MVHLTAVVLKGNADAVARAFVDLGAVQFTRLREIRQQTDERLRQSTAQDRIAELGETRRRIEQMLAMASLPVPSVAGIRDAAPDVDTDAIHGRIDRLAGEIEKHRKRQGEIQRQINRLNDVRRQLADGQVENSVAGLLDGARGGARRFLEVRYGRLPADRAERIDREIGRLSGIVVGLGDSAGDRRVLVVVMKRNAAEADRVLSEAGFIREEIPAVTETHGVDALGEADERIRSLEAEQRGEAEQVERLVTERRPELDQAWREVRVVELTLTVRGSSSESSHAAVFAGWVPDRKRERVAEAIRSAAGGACFLEWHAADEIEEASGGRIHVPVELRNPRFLQPFQMLVTNFGVPEYRTIDPTVIVAVAYLLMFGLMFGDAGHGLVLVLLGIVGQRVFKAPGYVQLSRLIVWCGGASIVMGVLFGAYFGLELLPPLWFDYHGVVAGHAEAGPVSNIMDILTITIYFGITVIALGLLLNWVNRIRKREWVELFFEKTGILGGIIYAAGVWVAAGFARSGFRTVPDLSVAGILIVVPAVLLFLKFPIEAAHERRAGGEGGHGPGSSPAMWIMNWIIELLEVFAGYLANTLSFMRVAGLGIAHVMLMVAFFQIADMISPDGTSLLSIIVLIFGNVLVIALEGLSAGIQSLRLNYYEFFSKYFVPSGLEFRPVQLNDSQGG